MHLAHPHQPRPAPHSPPSEQDHFFRFIFAIYVSLRPHRNHRFTWCIPISLGQLQTVLPASKAVFFQICFSRFNFLSGPPGTADSPGASPSAWASSTQSSQRAKLLIHIYFHDLFFCLAPPGPQIHLVHPHQPGPTPHSPPSEQNRFFRFTFVFFLSGPTGDHRFTWCTPISLSQFHAVLPASKTAFFHIYFRDLFSFRSHQNHRVTWVQLCQPEAAPRSAPSEQNRFFKFVFTICVSVCPQWSHIVAWAQLCQPESLCLSLSLCVSQTH